MAKRGRPAKAKPTQVERVVNANVLVSLVKTKGENKNSIMKLNGELGASIKHHAELSGLDRDAFAFIAKLNGKKEHERDSILRNVSLYADMMVEKGVWPKHLGDLAEQAQAAADAAANGNEPESPPPSDDEQEEDPRPEFLKQQERDRLAAEAEAKERVDSNVTALRRGIHPTEAVH